MMKSTIQHFIDERVESYVASKYKALDDETKSLRDECELANFPLILRDTELFLRVYLKALGPGRILEIGTAYGYSAIFFSKLLPESKIITIEKVIASAEIAKENIAKYDLADKIELKLGDADEVLSEMIDSKCFEDPDDKFDFVFIDAAKSHYAEYLDKSVKLCKKGSVIICDNVLMHGMTSDDSFDETGRHKTSIKKMREFLDDISSDPRFDTALISTGDGLAIIELI